MATMVPPQKGVEYITYVNLISQANIKVFQSNPTLAAGDVKVTTDGNAVTNLDTTPAVDPAGSYFVKVTVSATEMNGNNIAIHFHDAAGDEWCDLGINIPTSGQSLDAIDALIDILIARLTAPRAGYLDNLSAGAVALEATLAAIKGAGWTTETLKAIKDAIDALVCGDATEAKQDALEAKLDDGTTGLANLKALIDAIELKLDSPDNFKADVSALALEATVADLITRAKGLNAIYDSVALRALEATLTAIGGVVVAIDARLPADPADQSLVEAHVTAEVDDLITRVKGLNAIFDSVALRGLETTLTAIKGAGWTNETLKLIKELVDELESGEKPPRKASFRM